MKFCESKIGVFRFDSIKLILLSQEQQPIRGAPTASRDVTNSISCDILITTSDLV